MSEPKASVADQGDALLALYDQALPEVFGYLRRRCPNDTVAEDLTAETFLAAVTAVKRRTVERLTPAWLITVARNKLVDHWRRTSREERGLQLLQGEVPEEETWDEVLEEGPALAALAALGPHHRIALSLRHLDGLPVPQVAEHLGRTIHATEALLVRGRIAFRKRYGEMLEREEERP
ncbi:sigma-70 family RNA polymerase sigma factor [soil metagenome]